MINDSEVYLDEIRWLSNEWKHHLKLLDRVLTALQANRFTISPRKCEWGVQETDWFGYCLTSEGLKPWCKKIDVMLHLDRPRNLKQMWSFLGAVNYYRDMWPKLAHILSRLFAEVARKPFIGQTKWIMHSNKWRLSLAYPNHNKPFHFYTDAFDYQMGAVIIQDEKQVAYWFEN